MTTKTPKTPKVTTKTCKHPPHRLFCWWAKDATLQLGLCVVCLECNIIIRGGVE